MYIVNNATTSGRVYAESSNYVRIYESSYRLRLSRCPIDIASFYPARRERERGGRRESEREREYVCMRVYVIEEGKERLMFARVFRPT